MSEALNDRVYRELADHLRDNLADSIAKLEGHCGSPIEKALLVSLVTVLRLSGIKCVVCPQSDIYQHSAAQIIIVPQFQFDRYRIDFAIICSQRTIFVECDGHDFHERTKQQAAHDRRKDRTVQKDGVPILRFTGSEIYASPTDCCHQVVDFINSHIAMTSVPKASTRNDRERSRKRERAAIVRNQPTAVQ